MKERSIETINFTWQGIPVSVEYEAHWLGRKEGDRFSTAHIAVRTMDEPRSQLPITETGYRSHFTSKENIESWGGPLKFVTEWLDTEAESKAWKDYVARSRQFSLF